MIAPMRRVLLSLGMVLCAAAAADAQTPFARLPIEVLDVGTPSARVTGAPGRMAIRETACRPASARNVRRQLVDIAVQEWGYFGFPVVDRTVVVENDDGPRRGPRRPRMSAAETARIADSIAGYWAITPEGGWILENQNEVWSTRGPEEDWRYPWSAAFISWVMCEGGLGDTAQFRRAIAHHSYIDQAIRARDGGSTTAAYTAYDTGEIDVEPGDLLCSARRPGYETLAERRRQLGVGARTHCDLVVKVEPARNRILAIGGNVGDAVSLKLLPATSTAGRLRPTAAAGVFAHLKLRASSIEADALDHTPTIRALSCARTATLPTAFATASLVAGGTLLCTD
jgi:hypothetical protein